LLGGEKGKKRKNIGESSRKNEKRTGGEEKKEVNTVLLNRQKGEEPSLCYPKLAGRKGTDGNVRRKGRRKGISFPLRQRKKKRRA